MKGQRGELRVDGFGMALLDPHKNSHKETSC